MGYQMAEESRQKTISVATTDQELRDEVRRYLKVLGGLTGDNQDKVLLQALREYHNIITTRNKK